MRRTIRLTERDLSNLVRRVIREERRGKKNINEGILLTLGGIALGGAIIKKAYDYISNRSLINKMTLTGNEKKSTGGGDFGFYTMKEYRDNDTDEIYWGVDITDDTANRGFRERKVLLFKGDDPKRIEKILELEVAHDFSDQAKMGDDYEKRFGQFKADKVMSMGDNTDNMGDKTHKAYEGQPKGDSKSNYQKSDVPDGTIFQRRSDGSTYNHQTPTQSDGNTYNYQTPPQDDNYSPFRKTIDEDYRMRKYRRRY